MSKVMRNLVALVLFVLPVLAQTTGEIRGTVKDSSGNAVSGAKVAARFESTGLVRNSESDSKGEFIFPSIPVGEYALEVEAAGFKSYVQHAVEVTLGHVIEVEAKLLPGDSTEVLANDTPLVERSSTQLGAI